MVWMRLQCRRVHQELMSRAERRALRANKVKRAYDAIKHWASYTYWDDRDLRREAAKFGRLPKAAFYNCANGRGKCDICEANKTYKNRKRIMAAEHDLRLTAGNSRL